MGTIEEISEIYYQSKIKNKAMLVNTLTKSNLNIVKSIYLKPEKIQDDFIVVKYRRIELYIPKERIFNTFKIFYPQFDYKYEFEKKELELGKGISRTQNLQKQKFIRVELKNNFYMDYFLKSAKYILSLFFILYLCFLIIVYLTISRFIMRQSVLFYRLKTVTKEKENTDNLLNLLSKKIKLEKILLKVKIRSFGNESLEAEQKQYNPNKINLRNIEEFLNGYFSKDILKENKTIKTDFCNDEIESCLSEDQIFILITSFIRNFINLLPSNNGVLTFKIDNKNDILIFNFEISPFCLEEKKIHKTLLKDKVDEELFLNWSKLLLFVNNLNLELTYDKTKDSTIIKVTESNEYKVDDNKKLTIFPGLRKT